MQNLKKLQFSSYKGPNSELCMEILVLSIKFLYTKCTCVNIYMCIQVSYNLNKKNKIRMETKKKL